MYVSDDNIQTIKELQAFVHGALESAHDDKYWLKLDKNTGELLAKMLRQKDSQDLRKQQKKRIRDHSQKKI